VKKAILAILLASGLSFCVFAQSGVIKEISGTVELKAAGASAFTPAAVGSQVRADTVISTGFKSTALVEVGSAVIAVRPLTRLTLTEISASASTETVNMSLQAGRVRVDVNPPAGSKAALTVSSPSATASVRGTSFYFDAMNVRVREGTVAFKGNAGYTVQVKAGSTSVIDSYSIATPAQSSANTAAVVPPPPVIYDPGTTGMTGGSGVVSTPKEPDPPKPPTPPTVPPTTPPGGGNGGFGVDVEY